MKISSNGDESFSNTRSDGQGRLIFNQRLSNQGSYSSPPRFHKDKVSNCKPQGDNSGGSYEARPNCAKCARKHDGKCLVGSDGCYGFEKSGHTIRDCSILMDKGK